MFSCIYIEKILQRDLYILIIDRCFWPNALLDAMSSSDFKERPIKANPVVMCQYYTPSMLGMVTGADQKSVLPNIEGT